MSASGGRAAITLLLSLIVHVSLATDPLTQDDIDSHVTVHLCLFIVECVVAVVVTAVLVFYMVFSRIDIDEARHITIKEEKKYEKDDEERTQERTCSAMQRLSEDLVSAVQKTVPDAKETETGEKEPSEKSAKEMPTQAALHALRLQRTQQEGNTTGENTGKGASKQRKKGVRSKERQQKTGHGPVVLDSTQEENEKERPKTRAAKGFHEHELNLMEEMLAESWRAEKTRERTDEAAKSEG